MIGDIVKAFILYRIVSNPFTIFICTTALVAILLLAGAFIKFKNGIFSWICYLLVLCLPLAYVVLTAWSLCYPPEDLSLSEPQVHTYINIEADGITISKGILRKVKYPLLGIKPVMTQQRLDDIKGLIESYATDKTITYRTSKVYSGIIIYDDQGNDLNLLMLKRGYANVQELAPIQYVKATEAAKFNKVGIWAVIVSGSAPPDRTKFYAYVASIIVLTITSIIVVIYRRKNG